MLSGKIKKYFGLPVDEQYRQLKESYALDFSLDACILNYYRMRFWSVFLLVMVAFQLSSDFLMVRIWNDKQLIAFRVLDIYLAVVALLVFFVSYFRRPQVAADVKLFHRALIVFYLFSHVIWSATVAGIESSTAGGLPTYLIGVFSAATLFFIPGPVFAAALLSSLLGLAFSLHYMHMPVFSVINQYYTVFILITIAYITSRVLYDARLKSFIINHKLEIANKTLDHKVKERTSELSTTNVQLKNEIEIRIRFEKELKNALVRAEEADRLKTLFLANMSHEIRTPLNGILGFSDLVKSQTSADDQHSHYIDIIHQSGQQLLKIIDDILDISMIESNQVKINKVSFHLNHLMKDTYDFFMGYKKAENRDQLEIKYTNGKPDGEDMLFTDPGRLQQILNNLLKNATKFTEKGGIHFGYIMMESAIEFFVQDTGIGIKEEFRGKIFERFTQSEEAFKRNYGGNGLGLAISKGIVECLGGKIWLDTSYSPGARFCFILPLNAKNANESILDQEKISANFLDALKSLGLK
jgi:signal transduction histidine kinase